jgi:NACalpha-BTF3-like transcription factor
MGEDDDREDDEVEEIKKTKEAREMDAMDAHDDEDALRTPSADTTAALAKIREEQAARQNAEKKKAEELAAIPVKEEDVDLIVQEMELDKTKAKRVLQEHNGDVKKALTFLVVDFPQLEAA